MNFKRLLKYTHLSTTALTLISTALLTASFSSSFDMINGYFIDGVLPTLFKIFFVLGIVISFLGIFTFHKQEKIKTENLISNQKNVFLLIAAVLFLCSVIFSILVANKNFTISTIGSVAFATFILLCCLKEGNSHAKPILLLLSASFPLLMTIDNNSVVIRHSNSVENMLSSVFSIAFLIYILYEGKRAFTGEHSKWHFASMLLLTHTGFSFSISYIIVYLMGTAAETTRFYQAILILLISVIAEIELVIFTNKAYPYLEPETSDSEAAETAEPQNSIETTEKTDE